MPHCLKSRVAAHILMCPYLAGVHARNQEFYSGGGGAGPCPTAGKTVWTTLFFLFLFFLLSWTYFNRGGPMILLQRKLYFKGSRGGPEFSRGRGSNFFLMLISKETHITCDFPGDPDPLSPTGSAHAWGCEAGRVKDFIEYSQGEFLGRKNHPQHRL